MAKKPADPLLVIIGATGTAKSQLAIDLASRFYGEIINADAMQMYAGLPIITNKITQEEQKGIPHHLLGFIALEEEPWRVGLFKRKANQIIQEIRSRGRLPIVVGGTHYYTQSLLFEDTLVAGNRNVQETELSKEEMSNKFPMLDGPPEEILQRLKEVDPVMAARWHPNDSRKIRRSLEIFLTTGKKASEVYREQKESSNHCPDTDPGKGPLSDAINVKHSSLLFWVHAESSILKTRLNNRVDKMVEAGLLDEAKIVYDFVHEQKAKDIALDRSSGIWGSIGFKELETYLSALKSGTSTQGELDLLYNDSLERIKAATRRYANVQARWIRLKLIPALSKEGLIDRLYLLDGSNLSSWSNNFSQPAMAIAEQFMAGEERPVPSTLSEAAKHFLDLQKISDSSDNDEPYYREECTLCGTIVVNNEEQWQRHLKSRGHRARVRRRKREAEREEHFRQLAAR